MFRALTHRPLAVAGLAVLAGALWGVRFGRLGWEVVGSTGLAVTGLAVTGFFWMRRAHHTRSGPTGCEPARAVPWSVLSLALATGAAGLNAGGLVFDRAQSAVALRSAWSARAPPTELMSARLRIHAANENPWTGRASIVGVRPDGTGLRCSWQGTIPPHMGVGSHVEATGRLHLPRGATNPGQRDTAALDARQGIVATLFVMSPKNVEVIGGSVDSWRIRLRRLRREASRRLRARLAPRDAGVACALLLGQRSGLTGDDRLRFEATGTMHLLAISGMHLLLVAGLAHALARRLGAGMRAAAACALIVALLYVPIAGAGAPVRRAAIVLTTHALALMRGRRPDPASALGGALVVLLLFDPVEVFRIGFWLSFLAAAAIAALAPRWSADWSARTRLLARFPAVQRDRPIRLRLARSLWTGLAVSIAASCATQPWIAYHFRIVTPLSPFTNLLAAPFVTVLMPLVAFHAAGLDFCAPVIAVLLVGLRSVLDASAWLPGASLAVPRPETFAIVIWMVGVVTLIRRPRTAMALFAIALTCAWPRTPVRPASLVLLDVGHGQATLVRDRDGRAVLIDAGSRDRPGVGRTVVLAALQDAGISELACCVCTHDDADHWRGLLPLFGRIRIRELVVGESVPPALTAHAERHAVPVRRAQAGHTLWRGRGVRIEALADGRGMMGSNNQSVVALVRLGSHQILLPADCEEDALRALLNRDLPTCSVLVSPHHGAALDPPELATRLGRAVRPRWLLTSNGRGGFDSDSWAGFDPSHWTTARNGALRVDVLPNGGLRLTPWIGHGATIAPP